MNRIVMTFLHRNGKMVVADVVSVICKNSSHRYSWLLKLLSHIYERPTARAIVLDEIIDTRSASDLYNKDPTFIYCPIPHKLKASNEKDKFRSLDTSHTIRFVYQEKFLSGDFRPLHLPSASFWSNFDVYQVGVSSLNTDVGKMMNAPPARCYCMYR